MDTITRLLELIDDHTVEDDMVIHTIRQERQQAQREHESRLKQLAADNPTRYGVLKMVATQAETGGHILDTWKPTQHTLLIEQDMAFFAREHKLDLSALWAVVRGERRSVGDWLAWDGRGSSSKLYVDRSAQVAEQESLLALDRKHERRVGVLNEQRKQAWATPIPALPVPTIYTRKG